MSKTKAEDTQRGGRAAAPTKRIANGSGVTRKQPANDHKPDSGKPSVHRDGDAIVIDIPMNLRRRCGRKEIVLPPDATPIAAQAAPAKPPTPLELALARAFRWQEMIETGQARSNSDLARKLKLDQSYIARTIRLASLAPDIIEAILDGQEPDGISLWGLRRDVPVLWSEQREAVGLEAVLQDADDGL